MPLNLSDFTPIQRQRQAIQAFLASDFSISGCLTSDTREDKETLTLRVSRAARSYNSAFSSSSTLAAQAAIKAAREWLAPKMPELIAAMESAMADAEQSAAIELSADAITILTIANQKPTA